MSEPYYQPEKGRISTLAPWLRRTGSLPFVSIQSEQQKAPYLEYGGFVGIDRRVPLHTAPSLAPQSLEATWGAVRKYVSDACRIIHADEPPHCLDNEEVYMILEELGEPPIECSPLYLITTEGRDSTEEVVYVGKTSSSTARFSGGHAAITKLHHPRYDGTRKWLYLASVMLLDADREYLPLEAVGPKTLADEFLQSVEYQLIFDLQPELNTHGRRKCLATAPLSSIHVQNFISEILSSHMIYSER
jgi:hypothetical protein